MAARGVAERNYETRTNILLVGSLFALGLLSVVADADSDNPFKLLRMARKREDKVRRWTPYMSQPLHFSFWRDFSVIFLLLWLRRLVRKLDSTIKSHSNLLESAIASSNRLDTVIASSSRLDSAIESLSNHVGRKLVEIESKNDILLSHLLNVDVKLFDANESTNLFNRLVERRLNRLHASLDFVRTRLTTYLGNGISITYIGGDIPIYINSNDDGGPTDLINGRDYELR